MQSLLRSIRLGASALAVVIALAGASQSTVAFAQAAPPAPTSAALSEPTITALQQALNRQGIKVPISGVLNDETSSAIRKYQSQHHLPVTGVADNATLDKLGVRVAATLGQAEPAAAPVGSTPSPSQTQAQSGQLQSGMMMNCPMMQGQVQAMMQMMQGMMQMMQMMQGQMQPRQAQPSQMQPGQMPQGPMQGGAMQPRQN